MDISYFEDLVGVIQIPIAKNGLFWNGRADEFSNLPGGLVYSQGFGMTDYAKTGVYGTYNGAYRPHNGHDFAGPLGTPIVFPFKTFVTFIGYDEGGYGNFVFFETETKSINGETIKMEFVVAHLDAFAEGLELRKWYKLGELIGLMGSTGMSTGPHTHFAGRPLIMKAGAWSWAIEGSESARGYVDLTKFFLIEPIENKQLLINEQMKLVKLEGNPDVYAIDPKGQANLIQNSSSFKRGLEMGLWEDNIETVKEIPQKRNVVVLTPDD